MIGQIGKASLPYTMGGKDRPLWTGFRKTDLSHIQNLSYATATSVTQYTSNQSLAVFSKIREYFKLRAEIFSLLPR
jgi:hypothetical protein